MVCDGLRCLYKFKIAGKWPISSHRVAGPYAPLGSQGLCQVKTYNGGGILYKQCILVQAVANGDRTVISLVNMDIIRL